MRYFFNVRTTGRLVEGTEGSHFRGIDEAQSEALIGTREILAERLKSGAKIDATTTFEVRDEGESVVYLLPFTSVLFTTVKAPMLVACKRRASCTVQDALVSEAPLRGSGSPSPQPPQTPLEHLRAILEASLLGFKGGFVHCLGEF